MTGSDRKFLCKIFEKPINFDFTGFLSLPKNEPKNLPKLRLKLAFASTLSQVFILKKLFHGLNETVKVSALEQDVQNCSSDDPNFLERVQITSRALSDLTTALPKNSTQSQLDHRKIIGETLESKVKNILETYSKKVAKFRKRGRLGKRPIKSKMVSRDEPEVSNSEPVDQEEEAFLAEALAIRQGLG